MADHLCNKKNNRGPSLLGQIPEVSPTLLYTSLILFHLLLPFVMNVSIQLINSFLMLKLVNSFYLLVSYVAQYQKPSESPYK